MPLPTGARCVPRACGDGPSSPLLNFKVVGCSPRMRGWSPIDPPEIRIYSVFPAHAGMVPPTDRTPSIGRRVPRACGGGPQSTRRAICVDECSPRMRGWSANAQDRGMRNFVFPAHAGVVLWSTHDHARRARVPRACGGGPVPRRRSSTRVECSPRMRGWSHGSIALSPPPHVFPAHAGMVRLPHSMRTTRPRVPRACGDGPPVMPGRHCPGMCSPRMRGWSAG